MPTFDRAVAADRDVVVALALAAADGTTTTGSGIGIELELLPVARTRPTRRLQLHRPVASRPALAGLLDEVAADLAPDGVRLSVEPGGQVELSTSCHQRVPDALDDLDAALTRLVARFDAEGADLVAAGIDVWHDLATVPQQLDRARYVAMDRAFARRGIDGTLMMRHTCALQVNLDLGDDPEARWQVANLLAPITTATFACSPGRLGSRRVRSRRAIAWQRLDPSRTGFPPSLVAGRGTLADHVAELALRADVLFLRDPHGGAVPGPPGFDLAAWIDDGHPVLGWPTRDDVVEHLTTLFPEVRARGFLELRSLDAVPAGHRTAAVLLVAGALVDPVARDAVRGLLEPHRTRLVPLARRCAVDGLTDPRLCALAVAAWSYARAGAARLPGVTPTHLAAVDAFVDRYTVRGLSPADELAARLAADPADARRWATEPLPATSGARR